METQKGSTSLKMRLTRISIDDKDEQIITMATLRLSPQDPQGHVEAFNAHSRIIEIYIDGNDKARWTLEELEVHPLYYTIRHFSGSPTSKYVQINLPPCWTVGTAPQDTKVNKLQSLRIYFEKSFDYHHAVQWLESAGLLIQEQRTSQAGPLTGSQNSTMDQRIGTLHLQRAAPNSSTSTAASFQEQQEARSRPQSRAARPHMRDASRSSSSQQYARPASRHQSQAQAVHDRVMSPHPGTPLPSTHSGIPAEFSHQSYEQPPSRTHSQNVQPQSRGAVPPSLTVFSHQYARPPTRPQSYGPVQTRQHDSRVSREFRQPASLRMRPGIGCSSTTLPSMTRQAGVAGKPEHLYVPRINSEHSQIDTAPRSQNTEASLRIRPGHFTGTTNGLLPMGRNAADHLANDWQSSSPFQQQPWQGMIQGDRTPRTLSPGLVSAHEPASIPQSLLSGIANTAPQLNLPDQSQPFPRGYERPSHPVSPAPFAYPVRQQLSEYDITPNVRPISCPTSVVSTRQALSNAQSAANIHAESNDQAALQPPLSNRVQALTATTARPATAMGGSMTTRSQGKAVSEGLKRPASAQAKPKTTKKSKTKAKTPMQAVTPQMVSGQFVDPQVVPGQFVNSQVAPGQPVDSQTAPVQLLEQQQPIAQLIEPQVASNQPVGPQSAQAPDEPVEIRVQERQLLHKLQGTAAGRIVISRLSAILEVKRDALATISATEDIPIAMLAFIKGFREVMARE